MYEDETEMKPTRSAGGGLGRALKNLLLLILVLALGFGFLYLVAERNARRYFLVPEGGNLVVKRGIFFPVGEKPYLPDDPGLAAAYAPIPLPATGPKVGPQDFEERSDLDRTLFDELLAWAKPRIHSGESKSMEKGIYYLRRAEKLPTYTEAQRTTLEELQGEVSYYEAKRRLGDAVDTLEKVAQQLKRARDSGSARAHESQALLAAIEGHVDALQGVLDRLKGGGKLPLPATDGGAAPTPVPQGTEETGGATGAAPAHEATTPAPAHEAATPTPHRAPAPAPSAPAPRTQATPAPHTQVAPAPAKQPAAAPADGQ